MSLKAKHTSAAAEPVDCRQGSENREVALGGPMKKRGWLMLTEKSSSVHASIVPGADHNIRTRAGGNRKS